MQNMSCFWHCIWLVKRGLWSYKKKKASFSQVVPAKLYLSKPSDNKLLSYVTFISVESKILPE